MISVKKRFLLRLIRFTGIHLFFRFFVQNNNLTVIYYHDIDPISFEAHIKYLVRRYNLITINELEDYFYKSNITLPVRSVLITFDDGHSGNYKLLEIFKRYNIKPTIFLTANLIDSNRPLWFNLSLKGTNKFKYLRSISNKERLRYINENFANELEKPVNQCLSWSEVSTMSKSVDFQSHTLEHPFLHQCTKVELIEEILKSKKIIEEKIEKDVYAIAYPNGDYNQQVINEVKKSGYKLGFTTIPGYVNNKTNPYLISRFSMNDTKDINDFVLRLTGTWFFVKKLVQKL